MARAIKKKKRTRQQKQRGRRKRVHRPRPSGDGGVGNGRRTSIKTEVLAHLGVYLEKVPYLRERIFRQIIKDKTLYQKIAQKIVGDLT